MQRATCLERSLIMQRWLMATGQPHDVLIGVRSPRETTIAHAWLDHEDSMSHHVLMRLPPEGAPRASVTTLHARWSARLRVHCPRRPSMYGTVRSRIFMSSQIDQFAP